MDNLNASPSPFSGNMYLDHQPDSCPTLRVSSSSNNSLRFINDQLQDQSRYYHHQEDANLAYNNGSSPVDNIGLELTMWKEDRQHGPNSDNIIIKNCSNTKAHRDNPMKWMSSKMRLMQKMRNPENPLSPKRLRREDNNQKVRRSSPSSVETDYSSSNGSYQNTNNLIMSSSPIRVCSDCSTTKTPLWRSGPKGPKSLCNACGIRQRKARRAMAEAAASGKVVPLYNLIKLKEKSITSSAGHSSQLKKRCKASASDLNADTAIKMGSKSSSSKLEDFLIKLSNNLAFHRVFPQDEKDAAILLMALSSGLEFMADPSTTM